MIILGLIAIIFIGYLCFKFDLWQGIHNDKDSF